MSQSLIENLAAGLTVFLLEIAIILLLIPWVLARHEKARWKNFRAVLIRDLCRNLGDLSHNCGALWHHIYRYPDRGLAPWDEETENERSHIQNTKEILREAAKSVRKLRENIIVFSPAMSPKLAYSFAEILDRIDQVWLIIEIESEADITWIGSSEDHMATCQVSILNRTVERAHIARDALVSASQAAESAVVSVDRRMTERSGTPILANLRASLSRHAEAVQFMVERFDQMKARVGQH